MARPSALRTSFLLTGMMVAQRGLLAQSPIPDSQVEANVLKAFAGAPELASESISTRTVYGTVTLSGSVRDEQVRRKAETLAANADGVKKVVDELRLGASDDGKSQQPIAQGPLPAETQIQNPQGAQPLVLQSDGTYAAASPSNQGEVGTPAAVQAQRNNPEADQELDRQMEQQQGQNSNAAAQNQVPMQNQPQAQSGQPQYPTGQPQYPSGQPQYPQYPQNTQQDPYGRRPMSAPYPPAGYPQYAVQPGMAPVPGGQEGGQNVVVPSGVLVRVRINRPLSSDRTPAGTTFDGIVANDVTAGGEVAIPRGAAVQGRVLSAEKSGALKGRGEMQIKLTQVTLGGKTYPLVSDVWDHHGGDKTVETINRTAGLGAAGAIVGALAGGGVGAAVGGGVGAALGLGSSAASGRGQVYIPSETMLTFHTAQDTPVTTVSEQEMQRLAYGVPAGADQRAVRRPYPAYGPGYGPGYYPGPYAPYYRNY